MPLGLSVINITNGARRTDGEKNSVMSLFGLLTTIVRSLASQLTPSCFLFQIHKWPYLDERMELLIGSDWKEKQINVWLPTGLRNGRKQDESHNRSAGIDACSSVRGKSASSSVLHLTRRYFTNRTSGCVSEVFN